MISSLCRLGFLGLVLMSTLAACGDDGKPNGPAPVEPPPDARKAEPAPTVYGVAPHFELQSQRGETFGTRDLRGQVWVGNFFFTRCKTTCPVQRDRLLAAQVTLEERESHNHVHFVSISVDGGHDQPDVMKAYAEEHGADQEHWTFLTGDRRSIWLLSTEGFRIPAGPDPVDGDTRIGHSAVFFVVDRRGRIRALIDSQTTDAAEKLVAAIEPLVAERPPMRIPWPTDLFETDWLDKAAVAQREAAKAWTVRHDLRFRNRRLASKIRFKNRYTNDGGKYYLPVHYDHGNGVAVADVDGDGLYDLYFSNQVGGNELWRNTGDGEFEDITEDSPGIDVSDVIGVTASFADTDNDGDPDLFLTTVRGGNRFFVNDGEGVFTDATKAAGLGHKGHSSAGVFFDYNKDGLLDLLLCNVGVYTTDKKATVINDSTTAGYGPATYEYWVGHSDGFSGHLKPERTERSILYANRGGNRFEDVSKAVGFDDESWNGAAIPMDANGDGWLDLYICNMQGHDEYYENVAGKTFTKRSRELFPKTPWGSMGVKLFDYDADGDFDLYITDMHSDMSQVVPPDQEKRKSTMKWLPQLTRADGQDIWGNAFYRREADGTYAEISDQVGAENFWPWGLSVDDLNADGYDDVFITASMNHPFRYGINSVLLNDAGRRFLDSEYVLGVEPREGPLFKPWFDVDCRRGHDGELEVCEGYHGQGVVWSPLGSRSSVIFDLDGDGDLDIVTNDCGSEPMVLISDLAERGGLNALKIRLRGTKSNRDGLGTIVRVHVGGKVFSKVHDGQSGYLSQSAKPLYFGLGKNARADKIEVTWLSGTKQVIEKPVPVDGVLLIEEPK